MATEIIHDTNKQLRALGFNPDIRKHSNPVVIEIDKLKQILVILSITNNFVKIILAKYNNKEVSAEYFCAINANYHSISYHLFPLETSTNKFQIAIGKNITQSVLISIQELKIEINRLEVEFKNTILNKLQLDVEIDISGFIQIYHNVKDFIPNDNYAALSQLLFKLLSVHFGPKLLMIDGKPGVGKKTNIIHILKKAKTIAYFIENEGTISLSDTISLLKDLYIEIQKSNKLNFCLVITEILADSLISPYFSNNEYVFRLLKQISMIIPVIIITTINDCQIIAQFLSAYRFSFSESKDEIYIGRVIKSKYPFIKNINFSQSQSPFAEPLASINHNTNHENIIKK